MKAVTVKACVMTGRVLFTGNPFTDNLLTDNFFAEKLV